MRKELFFGLILLLLISGCAERLPITVTAESVGFFYGLWHGMILSFAWFISLFLDDVAIYATYNNGGWYDFGFILGIFEGVELLSRYANQTKKE